MKTKLIPILALTGLVALFNLTAQPASAVNLYWDTNDTATGSGAATGTWGTDLFWSTDVSGLLATANTITTGLDDLFFSAGTNGTDGTVTVNTTQTARLLTLEEGALTFTGGTISLAGGGGITVLAGSGNPTISSNLTLISGNNIFNVGSDRTLTLNTGTFTRANRATVNIRGAGNGTSTMTGLDVNVANIIGPWASVTAGGTTTYAKFVGSTISGLGDMGGADGIAVPASTSVNAGTSNTNYSLSAVGNLAFNADVRTLRYTGAAGALVVSTSFTTRGIMNVSGERLDIASNAGTVKAGTNSASEMVVNAVNGEIRFLGSGSFTGSITKTGSSALTFDAAPDFSGIAALTVNQGTLTTDAATDNTLVGATINRGGTLRWARGNKHRDDAVFTINAGGTLNLNGQTDTIGTIAGAGSITSTNAATMTLSGGAQAFSGVIGGAVALDLNLSPTSSVLTLSGTNTYTGDTTVNAGVLAVTGSSIADTGKLVINGSGKVDLTNTETVATLFLGVVEQPLGNYSATSVPLGATITTASFTGAGTLMVGAAPTNTFANWISNPAFGLAACRSRPRRRSGWRRHRQRRGELLRHQSRHLHPGTARRHQERQYLHLHPSAERHPRQRPDRQLQLVEGPRQLPRQRCHRRRRHDGELSPPRRTPPRRHHHRHRHRHRNGHEQTVRPREW